VRLRFPFSIAGARGFIAAAGATGGGLLGLALSTAMTSGYDNRGPLDFFPLDEAAARMTIEELRLAQ